MKKNNIEINENQVVNKILDLCMYVSSNRRIH